MMHGHTTEQQPSPVVVGVPMEVVALVGGREDGQVSGTGWYYAMRRGRHTGVYMCWEDAQAQVEGFSGAPHCKFRNNRRVWDWVHGRSDAYPPRQVRMSA